MAIFVVMIPALILLTIHEALNAGINKAIEIFERITYKLAVRERRSRSQRRWA
jgi:hypothetical protein